MNCTKFIDQVTFLMHSQQRKYWKLSQKSINYSWLYNKRLQFTFIDAKEEFLLRQALQKVNQEQRIQVVRQLVGWLTDHPFAQAEKIPEMCIMLLNTLNTINMLRQVNLSRQSSFRDYLKKFSIRSNKVSPVFSRETVLSLIQPDKNCKV